MVQLVEHPTVQHFYERMPALAEEPSTRTLDASWLRQLCLDQGADDVGFVEIDRPELAHERSDILALFPHTRTLASILCRMRGKNFSALR